MLKQLKPNLCPESISCDLEHATITSMKYVFQNTQINGYLYYSTRNFWLELHSLVLVTN